MNSFRKFSLNQNCAVKTPDAPGMQALLSCLRNGATIVARQKAADPIAAGPDDTQWILCETSGSSGQAKTIRRKPETWIRSFALTAENHAITARDTYATLGPLGNSLTLYATLEAMHLGAGICGLSGINPRRQLQQILDARATVIYATPAQLALLSTAAGLSGITSLPAIRRLFSGGGKLDPAQREILHGLMPAARIHEFFGAAETSFITLSDDTTPAGSVGRAYPGVTVRIGSAAGVPPGETGEIWVASPYLFTGYAAGSPPDTRREGEFLSIGEMGYLDADGYLFLRGRKNRMVTVADQNVFPEEIEQALARLDHIDACAAIAQPDPARGNRIVCFLQCPSGEPQLPLLRRHCRAALGPASVPKDFILVDRIPLLPAGKPDLHALRAMLKEPS